MRKILQSPAVRASAVTAVIIGACATIGADRFPVAFVVASAVWAVVTAFAITSAVRRAD